MELLHEVRMIRTFSDLMRPHMHWHILLFDTVFIDAGSLVELFALWLEFFLGLSENVRAGNTPDLVIGLLTVFLGTHLMLRMMVRWGITLLLELAEQPGATFALHPWWSASYEPVLHGA